MTSDKPPAKKAGATKAKPGDPKKNDGCIGCLTILALVLFILVAAKACSSGDSSSSSSDGATTEATSETPTLEDDPSGATPPAQTATYTCSDGVSLSVSSSGNDVTVTRTGEAPETAADFTEYVVTLNRDDGNKVRMLYQKNYTSGAPTDVFIYDADGAQINLNSDAGTTLQFPDALKGFGAQGWHGDGAVNVDGKDVATCS